MSSEISDTRLGEKSAGLRKGLNRLRPLENTHGVNFILPPMLDVTNLVRFGNASARII